MDAMQVPDIAAVPATPRARPGGSRLRTVIVLGVVAVAVIFVAWYADQPQGNSNVRAGKPPPGAPPLAGTAPPDFSATTIDGTAVSMAALKGQPTWLTIGASWCADCRAEALDLQATYAKYQPQGLRVLGIFIEEPESAVSEYAKRVGFTFPMVADPQGAIADLYRVYGIPIHYFVGRDGLIRVVRIGRLSPSEMEQLVQQILST